MYLYVHLDAGLDNFPRPRLNSWPDSRVSASWAAFPSSVQNGTSKIYVGDRHDIVPRSLRRDREKLGATLDRCL